MPKQEGPHYTFENLEFWAERGMISIIDTNLASDSQNDEQYHWRVGAGEFMKRAIAAFMQEPDLYASKVAALRRMLDDAKTACKLAKAQGDPMDPSVLDHVVRHQRKSSALVLPGELPPMPGMSTQNLKIKAKGATPAGTLTDGFTVAPDFSIPSGVSLPLTPRRGARQ